MKHIIFIVLLTLLGVTGKTQNLVGYSSGEIRDYMQKNYDDMGLEKVTNKMFKYLKYTDSYGDQTLIFFLNGDSVCRSMRLICAMNIRNEKIKEFNDTFRKTGATRWIDTRNGRDYIIELKDDKWSCTFSIEPAK